MFRWTDTRCHLELVTRYRCCRNVLFFPDSLAHERHNLPRGRSRKQDHPKFKAKRTWQEIQDIENGLDLIRRLPVYKRATRGISAYVPWSCDQDSFEDENYFESTIRCPVAVANRRFGPQAFFVIL